MTSVKGVSPDHIFTLLDQAMRRLREDMAVRGPAAGPEILATGVGDLRSSQIRLLSLTPAEGMRVTDLAHHVGMTPQALGEFARELESLGHLEIVRDPDDRRVRVVRPTPAGRAVARAADLVIRQLEADWRDRVGVRRWDSMRAGLVALASASASASAESVTAPPTLDS